MSEINTVYQQSVLTEIIRAFPPLKTKGYELLPLVNSDRDKVEWVVITGGYAGAPIVTRGSETPRMKAKNRVRMTADPVFIRGKQSISWADAVSILDEKAQPMGERYIMEELQDLSESVDVAAEILIFKALHGIINYKEWTGGSFVSRSIDMGFQGTHKVPLTGTNKWDDLTNSDPFKDLTAGQIVVADDSGSQVDTVLMNSSTFEKMCSNSKIRELIKSTMSESIEKRIETYLASKGMKLDIFDGNYIEYSDGVTYKHLLNGDVIMLANNMNGRKVGEMQTTPSEYNVQGGKGTPGKFVYRYKKEDPPEEQVVSGLYGMPCIKWIDRVYVLKAY